MYFLINSEGRPGVTSLQQSLLGECHRLDAIEKSLNIVEADESIRSVGRGGMPNICGVMQFDASILDGETLECGAVGALEHTPHAITLARKVMEKLPHVFLVGDGASRFARECGIEELSSLTADAEKVWCRWLEELGVSKEEVKNESTPLAPLIGTTVYASKPRDTVVVLVKDHLQQLASGASTSGWDLKYPGRLGDSPVIGAGHYSDSRYGAAACTNTGEMSIRTCAAHSVVMNMKFGMSPAEACDEVVAELKRLQRGHLGSIVLYCTSREGEHAVRSIGCSASYYFWRRDMATVQLLEAVQV